LNTIMEFELQEEGKNFPENPLDLFWEPKKFNYYLWEP
jgi:hypothetical protein